MLKSFRSWLAKAIMPSMGTTIEADLNSAQTSSKRPDGRGYAVYSISDLIKVKAKDKFGDWENADIQLGYDSIDPMTALNVFQKCAPVFGLVTGRANRVAGSDWHIVPKRKIEERIIAELKETYQLLNEYKKTNNMYLIIDCLTKLYEHLPELKPELDNFDSCLYRYSKHLKRMSSDRCNEIEDFLSTPSPGKSMQDFLKEITTDLLVHGRFACYKQPMGNRVGNLYTLAGGTVYPIKGKYVGTPEAYVQILDSLEEMQIFYPDEIVFSHYMPNSSIANGLTPIDALINMVTEFLFFEQLSKDKANEDEPPSKLIVFGEPNPLFGDDSLQTDPLDIEDQKRIENKLNRKAKKKAVATLSGFGTPMLVDLSKADIYQSQLARLDQINKFIAIVYNASNNEINETGGDGTSGRATSETNERNDNSKGVRPLYLNIESAMNNQYIPFACGTLEYKFEFTTELSDTEKVELAKLKKDSGLMTVNEIRISDLDLEPSEDPSANTLAGQTPQEAGNEMLGQIQESLNRNR